MSAEPFNPGPDAPGEALAEPEGSVWLVYSDGRLDGMADDRVVRASTAMAGQAGNTVVASASRTEIMTPKGHSVVFELVN